MGIIGGQDGPTAVFITGGAAGVIPALAAAAVLGVAVWLFLRNRKKHR